jgi:cholesterol transport system auxiliary component
MTRNLLIILCFVFALMGCSIFSPVKTEPVTLYVLNATQNPPVKKSFRPLSLYVAPIDSNPIYNTNAMAYSIRPYQINYFVKNRWVAPPSTLLHPLVIQALQKAHFLTAVSGSMTGHYDFTLNIVLSKLQQQFLPHASFIQLVVNAEIIKTATNQVIAVKEFSFLERAPAYTPYGGVIAANRATARLLTALSSFCMHNLDKNTKTGQNYYIKSAH